ncbi:MAG: right-handed parallel beta-helix repeat-containing protein [Myxococcales bacterium]|nr:right-handed parallel beta-helix repeat-containing protein [Myxococcales bacterium]
MVVGDDITFSSVTFPFGSVTPLFVTQGSLVELVNYVTIDGGGRVRIDGSGAPAGSSGLELRGDHVVVTALEITDFPGYGVWVRAGNNQSIGSAAVSGGGNIVRDNDLGGIRVGDIGSPVHHVTVEANTVSHDCLAPTGVCGGIELLGSIQLDQIAVRNNTVNDIRGNPALLQGTGILVGFGTGHLVEANTVGAVAPISNLGTGIVVASSGSLVTSVEIRDNLVGGNEKNGILLGPGSSGTVVEANRLGTDASGTLAVPNGTNGLFVFGSRFHEVRGNVISGNVEAGIRLAGGDQGSHVIAGNRIGVDQSGTAALPNGTYGIWSAGTSGATTIGEASSGNVVSGNVQSGLRLEDDLHVLRANLVGASADGAYPIPNGTGGGGPWPAVDLYGYGVTMGGLGDLSTANVVSGNAAAGVRVGPGADHVDVSGNIVGLAGDGSSPLANDGDGIVVDGASYVTLCSDERTNLVSANLGDGIRITSAGGPVDAIQVRHCGVGATLDGGRAGNGRASSRP